MTTNEYTLVGVMHFVDKWLNDVEPYSTIDDPDGQIAVERAAEARRVTLEYIEELQKQLNQVTRERDAAVRDLAIHKFCHLCAEDTVTDSEKCYMCSNKCYWQWRGVEVN